MIKKPETLATAFAKGHKKGYLVGQWKIMKRIRRIVETANVVEDICSGAILQSELLERFDKLGKGGR